MKKIKINQKLTLNKKKVSILNGEELENAKGGNPLLDSNPIACLSINDKSGCVVTYDLGYCAYTVHKNCQSGDLFC